MFDDSDSEPDDISYGSVHSDGEDDEVKKLQKLARKETLHVRSWRRTVLFVILSISATVIACTYVFLGNKEQSTFEESFRLIGETVEESINFELRETAGAMEDFSNVLSAHAQSSSTDSWPSVTLPSFETFASSTRTQTLSDMLAFTPLVGPAELSEWNEYSVSNQGWIGDGRHDSAQHQMIPAAIFSINETSREKETCTGRFPCAPIWQVSPLPAQPDMINFNVLSLPEAQGVLSVLNTNRGVVLGEANGRLTTAAFGLSDDHKHEHDDDADDTPHTSDHPHTSLAYPIVEHLPSDSNQTIPRMVAIAWSWIPWDLYLRNLLPEGILGVYVVVRNSCDQNFTYLLEGTDAFFVGDGDLHDRSFDSFKIDIEIFGPLSRKIAVGGCQYIVSVFPSAQMQNSFKTKLPLSFTLIVAGSFLIIVLVFFVYDAFVRKKDNLLIKAAARSNKIISSLFPSNVRDRILPKFGEEDDESVDMTVASTHRNLRDFMNGGAVDSEGDADDFMYKTKPIADLFPETTIVFADLVGFTAWSSVREPSQVFTLLETIYGAFDSIAKRRRVFKVETIGDCYVAVTGLPEPRKDHALAMARFAMDSLRKMSELTKTLETTLGPDTADLNMRFGLHSGPVTAGVLRGDRARFQLFGDTMNMAASMESAGIPGRIHLSQETADQLVASGKQHWVKKREMLVNASGKGEVQTYWLVSDVGGSNSRSSSSARSESIRETMQDLATDDDWDDHGVLGDEMILKLLNEKTERLVNWNVEVLSAPLKRIAARRPQSKLPRLRSAAEHLKLQKRGFDEIILDEVKEIIALPKFDSKSYTVDEAAESAQVDPEVTAQLREYVQTIASLYRENAFHNFEHASHVAMSTVKLLSRIVSSPNTMDPPEGPKKFVGSMLHEMSYGITSDPLTQFACIFSALIHDVDHSGVSNAQLVQENSHIAALYRGKSVAEQNSVDLAWDLLFSDSFTRLRSAIYSNETELKRFRQLVVNSVMATDIMDRDLKALRNERWEKAFSEGPQRAEPVHDTINRKATIVIEHLIQASDVSHTMQHWHVYRKWNECLFREQVHAFREGRGSSDPMENWYQGEIGFFDFYIIPLAKKLKDCGVFGVSSDEYLAYAMKNRSEWESKGKEIVVEMAAALEKDEKMSADLDDK